MGYNGKRSRGSARRDGGGMGQTLFRVLLFPALLVYLELVLHIYMKTDLIYAPVYVVFAIAAGFFFSALTLPWHRTANSVVTKVLAVVISVLYGVEIIAKTILQSYYGPSALKLAAGNKLTDYSDVIVSTVLRSIPILLVLLLPAILLCVLGGRLVGFPRFDPRFAGVVLGACVVFHLLGLGVTHLPWKGDITPARLYRMDTNIDDQVEQLGLFTMLRLDAKHMIFPVKNTMGNDFESLGTLTPPNLSSGGDASGDSSQTVDPGPVVDTSPNVMDIDLAALGSNGANDEIKSLAGYFNSLTPTRKNEYTGMFEGYNVIQLVLEGFSSYAIDPQLTPTLYKLTHEGFIFNNYYTALHYTSTSNGECQTLLGLYPRNGGTATMTRTGEVTFQKNGQTVGFNAYFSLAQQLGREGYLVTGYHPNGDMYGRAMSHSNLGYDWHQFDVNGLKSSPRGKLSEFDGLDVSDSGSLLWPQRDSVMVEASIDDYINSDKPFHVYYLTISGHMPYSDNRVVAPYRETVRALTQYSETTQNYIATCMEVDKALKTLLDKLEAAGKLDKTLIVATGDHIPYFNVDTLEELAGKKFGSSDDLEYLREGSIDFDVYKNSLILWSASMTEPVEVDKVCCQVDILPTLSNLLGLEYDSRMLAGSDILSDSEGLVVFSSTCWKSDRGFYNRFTQEFTPAEGVTMTAEEQDSYVSAMKKLVNYKLSSTAMIVENNFYDVVFGNS